MQSRIALPLRYGTREERKSCQLSSAQLAAVHWAKVDDHHALLDLDCGEGRLLQFYLDRYQVRACGITRNQDLKIGPDNSALAKAEVLRAQQHDIPWRNNSFDVVFLTRFNQHQSHNTLLFEEVHRVLKPGAQFVVTTAGLLLANRFRHMLHQSRIGLRCADTPFALMDQLTEQGFADVSMRSSNLRYTTIIAHKGDAV